MIREKKLPNICKLKEVNPKIFWRECCMCRREFKKQHGWRFETYDWGEVNHSYICNECAENIEQATEIVKDIYDYNIYYAQKRHKDKNFVISPPSPPKQPKPQRGV